jgi:hypothetical protein
MLIQPTSDDLASLMQRMAKAHWINKSAVISGKGKAEFNKKGSERMMALSQVIAEMGTMSHGELSALIGLSIKFRTEQGGFHP